MAIMTEYFWLVLIGTFGQILPRIDLNLCLNQNGQIGLIAIPDLAISKTSAKFHTPPIKGTLVGLAFISLFEQEKESSYMMPIGISTKQQAKLEKIIRGFREHKLGRALKSENWNKLVSEIRADNSRYLRDVAYQEEVKRIRITDRLSPEEPDDFQRFPGFEGKVPLYLYTSLNKPLSFSREQLNRELAVRQILFNGCFEDVYKKIAQDNDRLAEDIPLIHTIARVEAELWMDYDRQKMLSKTNICLDPALTEFALEPSPIFTATLRGSELGKSIEDEKMGFSIKSWNEPNIVQITRHVYRENATDKETAVSPAITIFRDEMGLHTLSTEIIRINTEVFSVGKMTKEPIYIDELEFAQIPELRLQLQSDLSAEKWWQQDTIARKIVWLATNYFAMRTVKEPDYLLFSVTPILDDAIQILPAFEELEDGLPYAYVVIKHASAVDAWPVFAGWNLQKGHFAGKYYCISRDGQRMNALFEIRQFVKPVYSAIVNREYEKPLLP
jgi:hypothetical protein